MNESITYKYKYILEAYKVCEAFIILFLST